MSALDMRIEDSRSSQSGTQVCLINDLPYDVFYLILVMCWDEAQVSYSNKGIHFPVIASHVCRLWRQHTVNTPSFWAKLTFRSKIPQVEKYQEWLIRLRGAPFDVYIGPQAFTSASVKHAKRIMRLIVPHTSHLRSLQVSYVPLKILRLIFDRLSDADAPLLQTLRVSMLPTNVRWNPNVPGNNWEPRPFHRGYVPNLRNVRLDAVPYGYILDRFGATLNTLVISPNIDLFIPLDYAKLAREILLRAPSLQGFGFLDDGVLWPNEADQGRQILQIPPLPSLRHSSLKEVYIGGRKSDTDFIVCSLALPQIRYFADPDGQEVVLGLCCLPTLGLSPFPNLVTLRLGGNIGPISSQGYNKDPLNSPNLAHLRGALQALSELRALMFERVDFEDDRYLTKCLGTAGCCPRLQRLALKHCIGYTIQELREVVETRQQLKSIHPLVRITVYNWPNRNHWSQGDAEARDWLKGVVDLRIWVTVTSRDEEGGNYLSSIVRADRDIFELIFR